MWAVQTSMGIVATVNHEDEARRLVARQYPNASRLGVYAWDWHGTSIAINHHYSKGA